MYSILMGLSNIGREDTLADQDNLTVSDLKDIFGEEVVRRGIAYMTSLDEADKNFREVSEEKMEEGYKRAGIDGDTSETASEWASAMEKKGIGIDE